MKLGSFTNLLKNRIKDFLVRRRAAAGLPHSLTYQSILQSIGGLSLQEKEAVWFELRKHLAESGESIAYAERIYHQFRKLLEEHGGIVRGASILELGPGVNLAAGLFFALAGAARYTAVDALAAFPERPVEFYRNVFEELRARPQIVGKDSLSETDLASVVVVDDAVRWNQDRVSYLTPIPAEKLPLPENHFDYVFSNASFEHFEQPGQVIRRIFHVLRPGGLTAHVIDLRDHIDFNKPLEFLKIGLAQYRYASPYGTNRWRAPDFERAFREAGFSIRKFEVTLSREIADAEYQSLDRHFRDSYSRKELEVLGILVVASKPAPA